jgi:serine/threonine-protein kinase
MTPCDSERLRLLLADQLSDSAQKEIAEHVAACENCRRVLESFAGDAAWWAEVQTCLKENAAQVGQTPDLPAVKAPAAADSIPAADALDVDFVVDFLEPCDQANTLGRLGEYEILEVIGRGGMGVVLKGFHRELGRFVAVKVMAPHLASSGAARQRFVREARAAAAIVHPNVMPIHSVSTASRLPYLVMPFVACESVQQRLDRQGPLELKEILRIGHQAACGLAAAHAQGLVHRDVKPANILLEKGVDRVMLTDFGLARAIDDGALTRTGVVAGTPQYMSPEQSQGEPIDERSDLFSLGSVLYALCTGRPPFRAETALGVLRRICDTTPRSIREIQPELPHWLEELVGRLHEKSPLERFQSAKAVAEILAQCLAHLQQPTVPLPVSLQRPRATPRRAKMRHWRIWASAAGLICLALGVWQFGMQDRNSPSARNDASSAHSDSPADLSDGAVNQVTRRLGSSLDELERRGLRDWDSMAELRTRHPTSTDEELNP